ncbi:MAG TPA: corrinoid protein [Desulfosporosinus sp.]|nr:corrinoid protein [Desulfosporosinus sp.]
MFDYSLISQGITEGDAEKVLVNTVQALKEGYSAEQILKYGLVDGMKIVADKYKYERVLIPEVLLSARAMHAGLTKLQPYLKQHKGKKKYKILIGTVEGDLHDIGKNLIKALLSNIGFEVIDLGVNVTTKGFVSGVRKENPHFLLISALLTTTMGAMGKVIHELEVKGLRKKVRIIVGGSPVTEAFSKEIGADYYFPDAFAIKDFLERNINKIIIKE